MKKIHLISLISAITISAITFIYCQAQDAKTGTKVGDKAIDLAFTTPEGKTLALSSLKGKVVLLDFWASWCGPCRRENPIVVAAYNKYKDAKFKKGKGFTIYSVSLDRTKEEWINAIKQDGLIWPNHVSDLGYWQSRGAQLYGVGSIPCNWLIDGNGVIIGKDLRGAKLEQALEEQISK